MLADDPSLVDARDDLGRTPLHLAAIGERVEIVRLLIEAGAQIDSRDDRQRTPFRHAAWENSGVEVLALLPHGADVNAVGFLNQPPLEVALFNQNESVIDFVLDNGATLPAETAGQFRLMYLAAINSSTRVFDLMFDIVPTLDPAGEDAFAFLRGAAYGGSAAILGHLLATSIDPDRRTRTRLFRSIPRVGVAPNTCLSSLPTTATWYCPPGIGPVEPPTSASTSASVGLTAPSQEPVLLPEAINGRGGRICPVVTPDGKYLFYLVGTEVHWVSTDFVEGLRG